MRSWWERLDWVGSLFSFFNSRRNHELERKAGVMHAIGYRHVDPIRLNPAANTIRLRPGQPLRRPAVRNTLPQHAHDQRQQKGAKAS